MQLNSKKLRKMLSGSLAVVMAATLALPAAVFADGDVPVELGELTPEPVYTCSSEGDKAFNDVTLKVTAVDESAGPLPGSLDALSATGELPLPAGAGAHLMFRDDGVLYEGKENGSLSIYEGCSADLYINLVPGYQFYVRDNGKTFTAYDGTTQTNYFWMPEFKGKQAVYHFTMPSEAYALSVVYSKQSESNSKVSVEYSESGYKTEEAIDKATRYAEYQLRDLPDGELDDGLFRWVVQSMAGIQLCKPNEKIFLTSSASVRPMLMPVIKCPDFLKVTESELSGSTILKIEPDYTKLKAGERIKNLTVKGTGYNIGTDISGAEKDLTSRFAMGIDGFYLADLQVLNCTTLKITAEKTSEEKSTVIDLSSGSLSAADLSEEDLMSFMNIIFSVTYSQQYDLNKLYVDGNYSEDEMFVIGEPVAPVITAAPVRPTDGVAHTDEVAVRKKLLLNTGGLYFIALDLNRDGNCDVRSSMVSGYPYGGKIPYDIDGKKAVGAPLMPPEALASFKLLRMSGAENADPSYTYETGIAELGKVTIKLFPSAKVSFTDDGKVLSEQEVRIGKPAKEYKAEKEGYTLKGWQIESGSVSGNSVGGLYTFKEPVNSDVTLKAVWEKKPEVSPKPGKTEPPAAAAVGAAVGTKLSVGKIVYVVTKQGDANNMPEVTYTVDKKNQGKKKTVKVPDTITVDGVTYKVTALEKNALANEKKAKTIILGKYIKSVPAKAVKGCKKLKTFKLTNTDEVVKLNKKFLTGTKGKIKLLVPKAFYNNYKKQIKKLKLTKKVTLKKY